MKTHLSLLALTLLSGCSQPQDPNAPPPKATPTPLPSFSQPPTTPTPTPSPKPNVHPTATAIPTLEPEPNWKALAEKLKKPLLKKFVPPKKQTNIHLRLRSGTEYKGLLTALSDHTVSLKTERAALTLERPQLHPTSRIKLFAKDYATFHTNKQIKKQKTLYAKRKKAYKPKPKPLEEKPKQTIKNYLQRSLLHPESTIFLHWYAPEKNDKGTQVRVKYKTRTDGFGMITERKIFFFDKEGKIHQVAGYKETPST